MVDLLKLFGGPPALDDSYCNGAHTECLLLASDLN